MSDDHDDDRCAQARKFQQIDEAFRRGDLAALRATLDNPAAVPNGAMPPTIGSCLVYAIYHSPLPFIRRLLEIGADPNAPAEDGFPPLIAALSCLRGVPGSITRTDVHDVVRLLLSAGADPNQRGINDYTALHMAVAERDALAVQILLYAGADPELRTRIDDCETPLEVAVAAGLDDVAAILSGRGQPVRYRMRPGLWLLLDVPGTGELVRRRHRYLIRRRLWLQSGEPVRWEIISGLPIDIRRVDGDGKTLITECEIHRRSLINGIFYGVQGMRVGGTRQLEIAPHLAYGKQGVPGRIPPNAGLRAEVTILEFRS